MQKSIIMAGIGGQGIQVGIELIGVAATRSGNFCLQYDEYGGTMRGGKSEATLTIGDQPISGTAKVPLVEAAIIMHSSCFDRISKMLLPGGLALVNSSLITPDNRSVRDDIAWVFLPISELGESVGHRMVGTMVAIGAFSKLTGLVQPEMLKEALKEVIPPYRHQMLEMDVNGVDLGVDAIARGSFEQFGTSTHIKSPAFA